MGGIKITPMPNPMTTGADIVYAAAGGVPTRLANGTAGQFLKSNGTTLAHSWADPISSVGAKANRATTQALTTATTTTVIFTAESWDTNSAFNTSTGVFTVPTGYGGKYLVAATVEFAGSATGLRSLDVLTNGTGSCTIDFLFASSASGNVLSGSTLVSVADGNTIEIQAYQNSGGNLNIGASGAVYNHVSITRVGS